MGGCLPCFPSELVLNYKDYACKEPLTDEGQDLGACKHILTGIKKTGNIPCVLCFTQESRSQKELQHEAELLQHCGAHPNVVKFFDYFSNWGGTSRTCLILELVDPPGNDLYEVHQSFKVTGAFMPMAQLRWYVEQLAEGLKHINGKGIVHRDMKVENMLIDSNHNVKIIDFGLAVCPPRWQSDDAVLDGQYFAPELKEGHMDFESLKYTDLWGIGCVLYYIITGKRMCTADVTRWNSRNVFKRCFQQRVQCSPQDTPHVAPLLEQLLHTRPDTRGSYQDVITWAQKEISGSRTTRFDSGILQKFPFRTGVPQALGMKVPPKSGGKSIGQLKLSDFGLLVIAVVAIDPTTNARTVQACVNAETVLHTGDWIFFGVDMQKFDDKKFVSRMGLSPSTQITMTKAKSRKTKDLTWFFPTFDSFAFGPQHANAVIGPDESAKAGQNALNLRRKFQINLCGIVNSDNKVDWWPSADKVIQKGDRGLLMRVPNFIGKQTEAEGEEELGGCAADIAMLKKFLDPTAFFSTEGLNDSQTRVWKSNSGSL